MKAGETVRKYIEEAGKRHGLTFEEANELMREAFIMSREIMELPWMPSFTVPGWGKYSSTVGFFRGSILRAIRAKRLGTVSYEAAASLVTRYYPLYKMKWESHLEEKNKKNGRKRKS
jgi:hypothetical protein